MSLMKDGKFWRTRLPMHSRLCYLAGFAGYVYTAVFTFIAPALAIGMLLFAPGILQLKNMIFVAPVLFYPGVIYPMWHRCRTGLRLGRSGCVRLGACLRAVGHAARQAARLAAVRQRRKAAGRSPAALGLPDRLELPVGVVGNLATMANDDDEPVQLLSALRARRVPARGRGAHIRPAEKRERLVMTGATARRLVSCV